MSAGIALVGSSPRSRASKVISTPGFATIHRAMDPSPSTTHRRSSSTRACAAVARSGRIFGGIPIYDVKKPLELQALDPRIRILCAHQEKHEKSNAYVTLVCSHVISL